MRFVILHYHIFKNAGSTVESLLDRSFGERFARFDPALSEGLVSSGELVRFVEEHPLLKAVSSHQTRYPVPALPGILFFDICFLRDPIDRIRSTYDYFRERPVPGDPRSDLANQTGLGGFIEALIEHDPLYVKNVQVNMLACAGDSDEPEARDLDRALERMRQTSFLGVLDCFGETLVAGQHALRMVFPELDCMHEAVNATGGLQSSLAARIENVRAACSKGVFDELLRLNALDCRLLEEARAEVRRRFERVRGSAGRLEELHERRTKAARPHAGPPAAGVEKRWVARLATRVRAMPAMLRLRSLFDAEFYRVRYPEVHQAGVNPLLHYVLHGAHEGRKPHRLFQPEFYRIGCPDLPSCEDAFAHFRQGGWRHASPHPLFDCAAYVEAHPEFGGVDPLTHAMRAARRRADPGPAGGDTFSVAAVEIQDVPLVLAFLPPSFGGQSPPDQQRLWRAFENCAALAGLAGDVVLIWQDASGRLRFLAQAQQHPFFESMRYDQLFAQVNRSLPC